MIKAVIFDWGGVLIENPTLEMVRYIAEALGIDKDVVYAGVEPSLMNLFQKGLVTEDQVWEQVCATFGVPKPSVPSLWKEAFRAVYRPREEMFSLASSLRKDGYKTGFLSNTEAPGMAFFLEQQYEMFDVTIFSCAEGTAKPESLIYEIALERLRVKPKEAIFIDDRPDFTAGAQRVGIHAILFESPDQAKRRLMLEGVTVKREM